MTPILRSAALVLALWLGLGSGGLQPAAALARQSMSFAPGDRARAHGTHVRRHARAGRAHARTPHVARGRSRGRTYAARRGAEGGEDEGAAAQAVPGKGFTLDNGVLTYPAPARFQPQNMKRR